MIKSKVIFPKNINHADLECFSSILGIKVSNNFGKYLGFPIFHKRSTHGDFQFILDNMNIKSVGLKTRFLNKVGGTTLAKDILGSISSHVMQFIKLPNSSSNKINKIQRNFIWDTTIEKRKIHMLSQDVITRSRSQGGLGI